jgi:hypothetical protein
MRRISSLALLLVAGLSAAALAQAPPAAPPTRIRGTVETFADHTLTIKERDGGTAKVALAPDFRMRAVVRRALADIKPGDMVGITSVAAAGGERKAVEVHLFPKDLRNVRIGEFPWDLGPGSLMTNGMVAEVSGPPEGRVLTVTYHGRQSEITVPADAAIVGFAPGSPSLLRPGATVFVIAQKLPDGSFAAPAVTAETNGVKPPM